MLRSGLPCCVGVLYFVASMLGTDDREDHEYVVSQSIIDSGLKGLVQIGQNPKPFGHSVCIWPNSQTMI